MAHLASPLVPLSWGELIDKITILEIKRVRIARPQARAHVEREYALLSGIGAPALQREDVAQLATRLRGINEALWEIEDAIRREEACGRFGTAFIALARSVYKRNDERAALKLRINTLLDSELVEEKSYGDMQAPGIVAAPSCQPLVEGDEARLALPKLQSGARGRIAIQGE